LESALNRYKLALKLDPSLYLTHFNIGRIYLEKNDFDLAVQEVAASFLPQGGPKAEPCLRVIRDFLKDKSRMDIPVNFFYNDLGIKLVEAGFVDEAIYAFLRSSEAFSVYADAYFNLALAYLKKGAKKDAIDALRSALRANPNHLQAKGLLQELSKKHFPK
jgi:tetratricopeptide (TPR) repeat protein